MQQIASDKTLEASYWWLCQTKKKMHHNHSVWHLRHNWETLKPKLQAELMAGNFKLSPLKRYNIDGLEIDSWDAIDSLVLKAMAIALKDMFKKTLSKKITHLQGNGGIHKTVANISQELKRYKYVFKSDVKNYYETINHKILLRILSKQIKDKLVLMIIKDYCNRLIWVDGEYHEIVEHGISMGCPLSPLIGAIYLTELDRALSLKNVFYVRYMDDRVVLTKTRSQLRKAVKKAHQVLARLKLSMHPDKTFIGKISKGFNFLGYLFKPSGLQIGIETIRRAYVKATQLYEQGASKKRIEVYWQRWLRWVCYPLYHPLIVNADQPPMSRLCTKN